MPYTLKCSESIEGGFRRIVVEQLDEAIRCFPTMSPRREIPFHQARKRIKKVRAALRLVRTALGEAVYRRENAACRDSARLLSEVRDAQVLRTTLDNLLLHFKHQISPQGLQTADQQVRRCSPERVAAALGKKTDLAQAKARLENCRSRLKRQSLQTKGWRAIAGGLGRTYREGSDAYQLALSERSSSVFHEWRKSAKYLRHQLEIIEDSWSGLLHESVRRLHDLSDCLGEDHDLMTLRDTVAERPAAFGANETVEVLFALIERRQEELRERSEQLGERIFAERPRDFVRRIHRYWHAWRRPAPVPEPFPRFLLAS
jgi:CHAD domain-containing protein